MSAVATQVMPLERACATELNHKIRSRTARLGVLGLGYVGLPLAVEFGQAGFNVTGIDVSAEKARRISAGESYIQDVSSEKVSSLVRGGRLAATTDFSVISRLDILNICVPTPLRKTKDPDMSYIDAACRQIAEYLHPGMLIILESTTYPGTTKEFVLPLFEEKSSLEVGEDFFLCFSPERVDPGNPRFNTSNTPKVVGGVSPACTELGTLFYSQAIQHVVPVSSPEVAEMTKLLENTFRMINIGLVNELAVMCNRMGIDVWEVIDAAATKPFGFMPFYPGPGLGGHCIPIDPFYLSWKSRQSGMEARFIELAGYVNGQMPRVVVERIQNALNDCAKPLRGSQVHILGIAYKADIDDLRESPALDVMHLLQAKGARVSYTDPYIPKLSVDGLHMSTHDAESACADADCVVIITNHKCFEYDSIVDRSCLIVDTRNALKGYRSQNIIRL
jgi:UDP-N-acetyl-D-glucosamine dehydrogenase